MISLSNDTVAANAPGGTLVAVIRVANNGAPVACNLKLCGDADGFFGVVQSTAHLVTMWRGSALPGFYAITIQANAINSSFCDAADFVVHVA